MAVLNRKNDKLKNEDIQFPLVLNIFTVLTSLPMVTVIVLLAFYFLVGIEYGELPVYANPDPKDSLFSPLMIVIYAGLLLTMASIPVWIAMLVSFRKAFTVNRLIAYILVYVLPIIAFLVINFQTPMMVWFMD